MIDTSRGTVTRQVRSIATGFLALFAAPILTALPGSSAQAGDACIEAPSGKPAEGSHWYYWTDRTTQQKCWFLGPERKAVGQVSSVSNSRVPPEKEATVGRVAPPPPATIQTQRASSTGSASVVPGGDQPRLISTIGLAATAIDPPLWADRRNAPIDGWRPASTDEEEEETTDPLLDAGAEPEASSISAPLRMIFAIAVVLAITGTLRRALGKLGAIRRGRVGALVREEQRAFTPKSEPNSRTGRYPQARATSAGRRAPPAGQGVDPVQDFDEAIRRILAARTRESFGHLPA